MPTDIYLSITTYSQPVYPQQRAMELGVLAHLNRAIIEVRGEKKRPEERNSDIRSNYISKQIGHQPNVSNTIGPKLSPLYTPYSEIHSVFRE
jgi:hypothetical protein